MYTQFGTRNARIFAARIAQRQREIELMHEVCAEANDRLESGEMLSTCKVAMSPRNVYIQPTETARDVGLLDPWHPLYDRRQDPRVKQFTYHPDGTVTERE